VKRGKHQKGKLKGSYLQETDYSFIDKKKKRRDGRWGVSNYYIGNDKPG